MSLRFRRTVRLFPGVRLNLSKSGAGLSVGPRGASVSIGKRGTYANVGLPGSGLSMRHRLDRNARPIGATNRPEPEAQVWHDVVEEDERRRLQRKLLFRYLAILFLVVMGFVGLGQYLAGR